MADKLSIFNGALRLLGERTLSSLSEDREPKRVLDSVWAGNEAIKYCLLKGQWNFAARIVQIPYSPSVTPAFGYTRAFEKPDDFIRTTHFCCDEALKTTVEDYVEASGFWYANLEFVYLRYVSADTDTGLDISLWPANFAKFVEAYLAKEIGPRITESTSRLEKVEREYKIRLRESMATDAMEEPSKRFPDGDWVQARGTSGSRTRRFTGNIY